MSVHKINGVLRVSNENPRYFTDDRGRAVYLTGSHTWNTLIDQLSQGIFNYSAYLELLTRSGHNFFRQWALDLFRTPEGDNAPLPFLRSGPGLALDGNLKFDLTQYNEDYFSRLRNRVQSAGASGIYVGVMLFEGWWITQWEEEGWIGHPFHPANNLQALPITRNQLHSLEQSQVVELQERYVEKVIQSVGDLDNVLFEIANEDGGGTLEWQEHFVEFVRTYEKQLHYQQHPIGLTFRFPGGTNDELFASQADWISPNSVSQEGYDYKTNPPPANGRKVILADTDHIYSQGLGVDWVWKCFTRGLNPLLMEGWDMFQVNSPARKAMGQTQSFAWRMDLIHMDPLEIKSSTHYCLAHRAGMEFLVYQPESGPFTLNLTGTVKLFCIEWFNPTTGMTLLQKETALGGQLIRLDPPWDGEAIAYLRPVS